MQATPNSLRSHVPALDGLRGVAVLAVMAWHAGLPGIPGGFLGVDVFFVLSGFLLTSLLVEEHHHTGRIALPAFYMRRALRLLPALLLLLAFLFAWDAGRPFPDQSAELHREAAATLLYVANWAQAAGWTNPLGLLGHAWSLSIEEQFYLAWPLLLGWLLRRLGARATTLAVALLAASSALWRMLLWEAGAPASRLLHGSDTRAEALLLGAVAALLAWSRSRRIPGGEYGTAANPDSAAGAAPHATPTQFAAIAGRASAPLAAATLLALFATASTAAAWMPWGGFTAAGVAAAVLVSSLATRRSGPVAGLLSFGPLMATGRISYGLYLWHWPVFLMWLPGYTDLPLPALQALRFALTFAAATASWHLLEKPVLARKGRWARPSGPTSGPEESEPIPRQGSQR